MQAPTLLSQTFLRRQLDRTKIDPSTVEVSLQFYYTDDYALETTDLRGRVRLSHFKKKIFLNDISPQISEIVFRANDALSSSGVLVRLRARCVRGYEGTEWVNATRLMREFIRSKVG